MKQAYRSWCFQWVNGGYNTVWASNRAEALALAKAKGAPSEGFSGLTVDELTLTDNPDTQAGLDAQYAGMFD